MKNSEPTRYIEFIEGSVQDPKPVGNPLSQRLARCLTCITIIVHFSVPLGKWVSDDGKFHTNHVLEFPVAWLPTEVRPA